MGPSPLPHHLPNILLQYLVQADQIPIHLLSKQLLQRHHFLRISPESQLSYLRWPSSPEQDVHEEGELTRFLDGIAFVNVDSLDNFPVRYTSDDEDTQAHVHVHLSSGLSTADMRLVFIWDDREEGSWKYHDIKSMPFPPSSTASLPSSSIQSVDQSVRHDHAASALKNNGDDDDSYWNSYGAQDDDAEDQAGLDYNADSYSDDEKAEDAYWAQYAKVQGTADSTIPSPLPLRTKQQTTHHSSTSPDYRAPSPFSRTLTDRLANLTPPRSPMFSPLFDKPQATEQDASPDLSSSSSATVDSVALQIQSMSSTSDVLTSEPYLVITSSTRDEPSPHTLQIPGDDNNLRTTIRGLYRMWANTPDNGLDFRIRTKENFMHIVMDSLVDM